MFDLLFPKWWSTLKKLIWLKAAALSSAVVKTVTAAIVHIKDALAGPAQNVTIAIEPVQSGSGDPSPDNVRPITGWSEVKLTHTGANIWGGAQMIADMYASMQAGTIDADAGTIKYSGPQSASHGGWLSKSVKFKPNTRYTFIFKFSNSGSNLNSFMTIVYTDGTTTSLNNYGASSGTPVTKVVTSTNGKTIKCIGGAHFSGTCTLYANECGLFEGVLTAADFQAYNGNTYTISLGDTRYGGTLDVTTGELTVTMASVDMGTLTRWAVNESYAHRLFTLPYLGNTRDRKKSTPISCSMYPVAPGTWGISSFGNNGPDNSIAYHFTDDGVWVRDDSFTTLEEFLAAVSGQTIVYELATPQTYQLTPQEVQLLAGENNIWADTGDTTLTYLADGRASDIEALGILLGGRYHNSGAADEATDAEALDILLGGNR